MGLWSFILCLVLLFVFIEASEDLKQSDRKGKALKISKKPCTDSSGQQGVCTFKWDCINKNGTLMGTCVDGFIFGTCCRYNNDNDSVLIFDNIDHNEIDALPSTHIPSSTTSTPILSTRRPIEIIRLTTVASAPTNITTYPAAINSSSQLVTWTSVGPTKTPQRPIILQPFPFRPGQGAWPMGVAFPVDPFQINRPLQVFRPPVLLQTAAQGPGKRKNASYTILNGPDQKVEMTTVSVPIPEWSTQPKTTVRPQQMSLTAIQSASTSTRRPLKSSLDYRKDCGVRGIMGPKGRIVGGHSAHFGRWPWQVLVKEAAWLGLYQKNKCGGVLVSAKYAVTAGHCQPGRFLSALVVILGEYDLLTDVEHLKAEIRRVKRMIVHRHYNPHNFDNDIALLELDPPVLFSPHIAPICLPQPHEDFTGKMAYVTGWGKTSHGGAIPNLLQEVQVPILSNSDCVAMFKDAGHAKLIKDTFLCAGYKTGGKDSCEGDSGGPLMVERENGQWVLVGTVSHGIRCADPNLPGVYMKVSAYRSWIDKIIK